MCLLDQTRGLVAEDARLDGLGLLSSGGGRGLLCGDSSGLDCRDRLADWDLLDGSRYLSCDVLGSNGLRCSHYRGLVDDGLCGLLNGVDNSLFGLDNNGLCNDRSFCRSGSGVVKVRHYGW